jgi:SAM-dependent methyltransferase
MSFNFHHNKPLYFQNQYLNSKNDIIPFINQHKKIVEGAHVLEIGCAEGGVLKAFVEAGCVCTGVELSQSKIDNAYLFMAEEIAGGKIKFICQNVYDLDFETQFLHHFDIIVLKDTIEHIPNQHILISYLRKLLKKDGVIFFGFPSWYMPWGGHQQICQSKFLMFLPYFHLLPTPLYKLVLKLFKEPEYKIKDLLEIKQTGISINRFEAILKKYNYKILSRTIYLINPIYKLKFGWKPRVQPTFLSCIPILRDFLSTTVYYLVK